MFQANLMMRGVAGLGCIVTAGSAMATVPEPAYEFLFEETGTVAINTGTEVGADLYLVNGDVSPDSINLNFVAADLHDVGNGFNGSTGFNTGATAQGSLNGGVGGAGVIIDEELSDPFGDFGAPFDDTATLDSFVSYTKAGWFKASSAWTSQARLWAHVNTNAIRAQEPSNVAVYDEFTQGFATTSTSVPLFQTVDEWEFWAVTREFTPDNPGDDPLDPATVGTSTAKFYVGGDESGENMTLIDTVTLAGQLPIDSTFNFQMFMLGNREDGQRPFHGVIDDFRIWGAADSEVDGALTLAQLEEVRIDAVGGGGVLGDLNGDGKVDGNDFGIFAGNFGLGPGATEAQGDLTGDGFIDGNDFGVFAGAFGTGTGATAAVPEPASLALLSLGGLVALRRRRSA